jgi:hypothetical protein
LTAEKRRAKITNAVELTWFVRQLWKCGCVRSLISMAAPSTAKVLACRELGAPSPCEAYIEWAIGRLESGDDSPALGMLAGSTSSDDPRSLERLFESALKDLDIPSVRGDAAIRPYVAELLWALLRGEASAEDVLGYLKKLWIERNYPRYRHSVFIPTAKPTGRDAT